MRAQLSVLLLPALLALSACATAPKPLQGDYASAVPGSDTAPKPLQGDYASAVPGSDDASAQRVRWGGEIIRVDNAADRSCFEVLARPLDSRARPLRREQGGSRFLACRSGFYDPAVFERGREITVTGTVNGSEVRKVGDYDYRYPRVDADVIYLWREPVAYGPGADPWLYGWGWDPFWARPFGPPLIIVHRHHHR